MTQRLAALLFAVLVLVLSATIAGAGGTGRPAAPQGPSLSIDVHLPSVAVAPRLGSCGTAGALPQPSVTLFNISAEGTGVEATTNLTDLVNNSGVNTTLTVPSPTLSSNQYVFLGVGEPITSAAVVAVGAAETGVPLLGTVSVPVAFLPNGTEVYSLSGPFLTLGARYTFAALHFHGNWWNLTYSGHPITGGAGWENGTYDLGAPTALGVTCAFGTRAAPSFLVALYGNGTAPPTLPTTLVPRAVGVAPGGSSSATYLPRSANALPQLNASLGTVYLEGSVQNSSIPTGAIRVGSQATLGYPGPNASVWGSYTVRSLGNLSVAPSSTSFAYGAVQPFTASGTDEGGLPLSNVTFSWQLEPATLGTLNATAGSSVTFTAGTTTVSGSLWVNASYNCSVLSERIALSVSPQGGPPILSFTASPSQVVTGASTNLTVETGAWSRPLSYEYIGLPPPCSSANTSRLACVPTVPGTFEVTVFVNDSTGLGSYATTPLTVYPTLQLSSFTATPNPLPLGGSVSFAVQATGGVPPLSYSFSGVPAGCPSGAGPADFSCRPTATGAFLVHATVNDSSGNSATVTLTLVVTPAPAGPVITGFTAMPNPVGVGGTTVFRVNTTGGTAPLTFTYSGLPPGCASANLSQLSCTPNASGSYTVTVHLRDAGGRNASANLTLAVTSSTTGTTSPPPSLSLELVLLAVVLVTAAAAAIVLYLRRRRRSPPSPAPPPSSSTRDQH